jgi:hypothetical protein
VVGQSDLLICSRWLIDRPPHCTEAASAWLSGLLVSWSDPKKKKRKKEKLRNYHFNFLIFFIFSIFLLFYPPFGCLSVSPSGTARVRRQSRSPFPGFDLHTVSCLLIFFSDKHSSIYSPRLIHFDPSYLSPSLHLHTPPHTFLYLVLAPLFL